MGLAAVGSLVSDTSKREEEQLVYSQLAMRRWPASLTRGLSTTRGFQDKMFKMYTGVALKQVLPLALPHSGWPTFLK